MTTLFTNKKGNPILIVTLVLILILFLGGWLAAFKIAMALKQIPAWAWIGLAIFTIWFMMREKK